LQTNPASKFSGTKFQSKDKDDSVAENLTSDAGMIVNLLIQPGDVESVESWLMHYLHPNGLTCTHCHASWQRSRPFRKARRSQITDYRCRECGGVYNIYTGTTFERKQLHPEQLIKILKGISKGNSTVAIAAETGISWRTIHELRKIFKAVPR
jgi:transposase-like protein